MNKKNFTYLLLMAFLGMSTGFLIGKFYEKKYVLERCLEYAGKYPYLNSAMGAPKEVWCNFWIGEIKARDEQ